jgi:CheY-like chemotaxis protein
MSRSFTMLFVDDEPDLREVVAHYGRVFGYQLEAVSSANEALILLEKRPHQVDMVFTDHVMPGMDGIEFLTRVRQNELWLPFILWSGNWCSTSMAEAKRQGNVRIIDKPFSPDQLAHAIRDLELSQFLRH